MDELKIDVNNLEELLAKGEISKELYDEFTQGKEKEEE